VENGKLESLPLNHQVAAVSCGIVAGIPMLDLDYKEDSTAQADANFVFTDAGAIIEVQATAEDKPFEEAVLFEMMSLARLGIGQITALQRAALGIE
jgi:ribonuclease PH